MGLFGDPAESFIERERQLELENVKLRTLLDTATDREQELRGRLHDAEVRNDRLLNRIMRLTKPAPAATAAAAPQLVHTPAGPVLGPRTVAAIARVAGADRALGAHLTNEAQLRLMEKPDLEDKTLAALILSGEDPGALDADEELAEAGGRVIPGGGAE